MAANKNDLDEGFEEVVDLDPGFEEVTPPSIPGTLLRSGISGVTLGFDDEIQGGLDAVGSAIKGEGMDQWANAYRSARDEARRVKALDEETNPKTAFAGNILGGLANPAKLGLLAGGGIAGLGYSNADLTQGEVLDAAKDTAQGMAIAKVIGTATPYAAKGAKKLYGAGKNASGKVFDYLAKKGGKIGANTPESHTAEYIARSAQIKQAPTDQAIKDTVDSVLIKLQNDLESSKISLADAKQAYRDFHRQVVNDLGDQKMDARAAVQKTNELFKEAQARIFDPLKAAKPPTHLAPEINSAMAELKQKVTQGSGQAYNVLDKAQAKLPKQAIIDEVNSQLNKIEPIGKQNKAAIRNLKELLEDLNNYPDEIDGPTVKGILKSLDKDIEPPAGPSDFMDPSSQHKSVVRSSLDTTLKEAVPEYREAMGPVAKDTRLLSGLNKGFGDEGKAVSRLNQIGSPKGYLDREAITQLEQRTGRKFTPEIDTYLRTQKLLKDPQAMKALREGLPEYKAYQEAERALARRNPDWTRRQVALKLNTSPEAFALAEAEAAAQASQSASAPFQSLSPNNSEALIRRAMLGGDRNFAVHDRIKALSKAAGVDLEQQIKDRGILNSFEKTDTQGARKTAFGGFAGGSVGAAIGFALDRYSAQIFKGILDKRIQAGPALKLLEAHLGMYAKPLVDAAKRGPSALAATQAILSKDPEFKQLLDKLNSEQE